LYLNELFPSFGTAGTAIGALTSLSGESLYVIEEGLFHSDRGIDVGGRY
jgi:hypothetical protein